MRIILFILLLANPIFAQYNSIPGRVAISSDGNDVDCDDISATPMSLALMFKSGNASKLVYYGYNDHIWSTGQEEVGGQLCSGNREEKMRVAAEDTASLFGGFNMSAFHSAIADWPDVSALTAAINASTASDHLYIIAAGPVEVIGEALEASNSGARQYVTVISHSNFNNTHGESAHGGQWNFSELNTVLGANIDAIPDQNTLLVRNQSFYNWLNGHSDPRLDWLWDQHVVSGLGTCCDLFDPSDAGMMYYLITGDEAADVDKVRTMLEQADPTNAKRRYGGRTRPVGKVRM
jgi:hypothetical protein